MHPAADTPLPCLYLPPSFAARTHGLAAGTSAPDKKHMAVCKAN